MNVSPVGILVTTSLLLLGLYLRGPVVIGLIASLAFGSTAIVTLGSLGGSSPLIYTCFVAILLLSIVFRTKVPRDIGTIFARSAAAWIVATIVSYAVVGSFILPRLFAGQTSAFVPSRLRGGVLEVPLEPVSGNITQTGYLVLGAATFLAIAILLVRNNSTEALRRGFFAWCILHATMGVIDLATKIVGAGDVLEPIRTASYVMLTQAEEAGFFRIAGAYSEASAFGGVTLACLAFTLTYWRRTKSLPALSLATLLLVLLMLSTSSTAYVGAMLLSIPLACSVGRSILVGQLTSEDLLLIVLSILCIVGVMAIYLHTPEFFEPIIHLFETTVINKPLSASGQERAYWNYKSLQSFLDTGGLGIGLGSSRASSWLIAVLLPAWRSRNRVTRVSGCHLVERPGLRAFVRRTGRGCPCLQCPCLRSGRGGIRLARQRHCRSGYRLLHLRGGRVDLPWACAGGSRRAARPAAAGVGRVLS